MSLSKSSFSYKVHCETANFPITSLAANGCLYGKKSSMVLISSELGASLVSSYILASWASLFSLLYSSFVRTTDSVLRFVAISRESWKLFGAWAKQSELVLSTQQLTSKQGLLCWLASQYWASLWNRSQEWTPDSSLSHLLLCGTTWDKLAPKVKGNELVNPS